MYMPDKGDLVSLNFDLSAGHEITKYRPAIVISRKAFNQHTGFAVVAPITSTKRGMKLEVILEDTVTQGVILIHHLRSLDVECRGMKFIEKAPDAITKRVTKMATVILQ